MLATLFDRCMKRRGVKESDPYDWEKTDVQQAQAAAPGQQQQPVQTSVHQPVSGATNVNNNNGSANMNHHTNNNNNNLIHQTTSLVNRGPRAGADGIDGVCSEIAANVAAVVESSPEAQMYIAQIAAIKNGQKPATKPKDSGLAGQTPISRMRPDNNNGDAERENAGQRGTSTASAAGAYFTSAGDKKESTTGTMVTAGENVGGAAAASATALALAAPATAVEQASMENNTTNNIAFHIQNHLRGTGGTASASSAVPPSKRDNVGEAAGIAAGNSNLLNNNSSDGDKKRALAPLSTTVTGTSGAAIAATVKSSGSGVGTDGKAVGLLQSATDAEIRRYPALEDGIWTSSVRGLPGKAPNNAADSPDTGLSSVGGAGSMALTSDVLLRANKENKPKQQQQQNLHQAQQQFQSARATSGVLHPSSVDVVKKRQLGMRDGSASGAMTTGRLRVLTAPPISCQDLALEVEKKTGGGDPISGGLISGGSSSKRQLRNSGGSGSRICDEKRNSSSIGGTANNSSRVSNSSRDSKLMNLASTGERGSTGGGGGGGGDSDRVGDHSMTQFALIDDDNVSQQMTRGGGCGGHTLASQWKSQFDDSEETTDNEWRQEPQSPDICLSKETNLRSSSHQQQYSQSLAGAISKRRSKSGVPTGSSSSRKEQHGELRMSVAAVDGKAQQQHGMMMSGDGGGGGTGGGLQKSASSHQLQCCVHEDKATDANNNSGILGRALVLTNNCSGVAGGEDQSNSAGRGLILNQLSDQKKEKVKKRLENNKSRRGNKDGSQGMSRIEMGYAQRFANMQPMRQNSQNGAHLNIQGIEVYDNLGVLPPCWSEPALNASHLRYGLEPPFLQQAAFDDHVYHIDIRRNVCMCRAEGEQLNDFETESKYKSCPNLSTAGLGGKESDRANGSKASSPGEGDNEEEVDNGAPISGKLEIRVLKSPQPPPAKIVAEQLKKVPAEVVVLRQSKAATPQEEPKKKEHRLSRIPVAVNIDGAVVAAAVDQPTAGMIVHAAEIALPDTPPLEDLTPALRRRRRRDNTEDKYVKDVDTELNLRFVRRSRNLDDEMAAGAVATTGVAGSAMMR